MRAPSRAAKRYAKALFELAEEQGATDAVQRDFEKLAGLIRGNTDLAAFLSHAGLSPAEQQNGLKALFEGRVHDLIWRLLVFLVESPALSRSLNLRLPRGSIDQVPILERWVNEQLRQVDLAAKNAGGRIPMRRLNRDEYANTVRDLLKLDEQIVRPLIEDLPADGQAEGFDRLGVALFFDQTQIERSLDVAAKIAARAIVTEPPKVNSFTNRFDIQRKKPAPDMVDVFPGFAHKIPRGAVDRIVHPDHVEHIQGGPTYRKEYDAWGVIEHYSIAQTVTQGIVSATGRDQLGIATFENFIQTDAPINPGNSGGALINTRGELIGVNTAIIAKSLGVEGIGFAIPVNLVRGVVNEIVTRGKVLRGWIGVGTETIDAESAKAAGFDGAVTRITRIAGGSPAQQAGLLPGDIILKIDDKAARSSREVQLRIADTSPGQTLAIEVQRGAERGTARVRVDEAPQQVRPR